jgi:ABC-2 type transport system permease protein
MGTYLLFLQKSFQQRFVYRTSAYIYLLSTCLRVFIMVNVWTALYGGRTSINGVSLTDMLNFIVISAFVYALTQTRMGDKIANKVVDGSIAVDFLRPIRFKYYVYADQLGENLYQVLLNALPVCILASIIYGFQMPADPENLLLFIFCLFFGVLIIFSINYIVGLISFWSKAAHPTSWFLSTAVTLFGGTFVPIWFYPDVLRRIAMFLPFRLIYFEPINIYLGRVTSSDAVLIILVQVVWLVVLWLVEQFMWSKIQTKLTVQGG